MGAVAEAGAVGNVVVSEEDMGVGVTVLHHLPLQFKTNPNSPRLVLSDEVKHICCTKLAMLYLLSTSEFCSSASYCATVNQTNNGIRHGLFPSVNIVEYI
jgi:hypothetical protein